LKIDYESVSAAFAHIIDNAVKYTARDTDLSVSFISDGDKYIVKFDMISIKIDDDESQIIFDENYSGRHTKKAGLSGKGIGLGIVRRLLALNKASISIASNGGTSFTRDQNPYQNNIISLEFMNRK